MSNPPEIIAESILSIDSESDDGIEELDEPKDSEIHLCGFCHKLSSWTQFLLYGLLGQLITLTPAVVIIILKDIDPKTIFYNNFSTDVYSQVLRWAFFFNLSWLFLLAVWRVIGATPYIVTSAIMLIFKKCPENIRFGLEFVVVLRGWACLAGWMIFNSVLFRILFSQLQTVSDDPDKNALANQWQTALSVILTLMVLSIFIFIQKFFLHTIAVNFHKRAFADRISKSKKSMSIIDKLRKSIRIFKFGQKSSESNPNTFRNAWFARKKAKDADTGDDSLTKRKPFSPENTKPPSPIKIVMSPNKKATGSPSGKLAPEIKESSEKRHNEIVDILRAISSSAQYNRISANLEVANDRQAKKLAKQIFLSLSNSKVGEVLLTDFKAYFESEADASEAFDILDTDHNKSITEREMKVAVVNIYREKRAIFNSMQDFSLSLKNLDNFFLILSGFATTLFVLPIWGLTLSSILPFTSIILALSFIFGGSAKATFDCLIFLFVQHPYDAGDRVIIDDQTMIVQAVSLLTTTFLTGAGVYISSPNLILATKTIRNLRRSEHQGDSIIIQIDFNTPESKIFELREKMHAYIISQNRDFYSTCDLSVTDISNLTNIKLSFYIKHKSNWQNMKQKTERTNGFLFALKRTIIELDIKYFQLTTNE